MAKQPQFFLLILVYIMMVGCVGEPVQPKSQEVSIAPIGSGTTTTQTEIKREQLSAEIRRFADRYAGRMSIESERIMEKATDADLRWFATGWNLGSQRTVLEIAVGPNAVENLLDMLVFTSLTEIEVENYFVPKYLGDELGAGLIKAAHQLEGDIWGLSSKVLTAEQQGDLRALIAEWKKNNPDQHFFWFVRFSGFSGQRAKDLERIEQTGGLLAEVQKSRETAEEIQAFSERLLYYLQRAPAITRHEATLGIRELFRSPEIRQLMDDTHRISQSSERYAITAEQFPAESLTAINILFDRLSREREAAILQLYDRMDKAGLDAIEHLAEEQGELITRLLVSDEVANTVDRISEEGGQIANITFFRGALLILLWVIAYVAGKLTYDFIKYRLSPSASRPDSTGSKTGLNE